MLLNTVRRSVEGDAKKSICQIRGVPHPQACSFVAEATRTLAVAGWDGDGGGVLLLSQFSETPGEEPKRIGYHVVCKSAVRDETEEAKRRRRMRGWTPEVPQTPEGGRLYVGERMEILEKGMEQIVFEETDEFVSVTTVSDGKRDEPTTSTNVATSNGKVGEDIASSQTTGVDGVERDPSAVSDSVRTEPLDDEVVVDPSKSQ